MAELSWWVCLDCGWAWPLSGPPPRGAECDNCGSDDFVPEEATDDA